MGSLWIYAREERREEREPFPPLSTSHVVSILTRLRTLMASEEHCLYQMYPMYVNERSYCS